MPNAPLAVIVALEDELRLILSRMLIDAKFYKRPALLVRGRLSKHPLWLLRSGMGKEAMRRGLQFLFEQESNPMLLIHLGYCGGADPKLVMGDLVIADALIDVSQRKTFSVEEKFISKAMEVCKRGGLRHWRGNLATVDQHVLDPHEKAFVGTQHGAVAVDMESAAVAEVAAEKGIPFLVARAVIDPLDMVLPDMSDVMSEGGEVEPLSLVRHMIRSPRELFALPKMYHSALKAREAITKFLSAWTAWS